MSLFDRLQKSRGQQANALADRLEQQGQKSYKKDPRIWKWVWNKEGISENIIRFLPIPMVDMQKQENGEISEEQILTPVAMVIKHQFQGPGGWYINNSPQTFGESDPVREHDQPLWQQAKATNDEALKTKLKKRLPSTQYYANILVISDVNAPENNGKVMLLEFGPAVKKILDAAQAPKFANEISFDPYDPWEGANLNLNLIGEKKKFGEWEGLVPNFAKAAWDKPSALGNEEFIKEIWEKEHSLFEFFDRKNYKSYEELETQLRKVLQIPSDAPLSERGASTMAQSPTNEQPTSTSKEPDSTESTKTKPAETTTSTQSQSSEKEVSDIDDFEQYLKG